MKKTSTNTAQTEALPTDAGAWSQIVKNGQLSQCRVESIVAAVRALHPVADRRLRDDLMKYVGVQMVGVLRPYVGRHHANGGEELIATVSKKMLIAIIDPASKDGEGLCHAFVTRLRNRALDEFRRVKKERDRVEALDDKPPDRFAPASHAPFHILEQRMYVDQMLAKITDARKQLTFRLFMDGWSDVSIAETVGKSDKTVRAWIKEGQELLKKEIGERQ